MDDLHTMDFPPEQYPQICYYLLAEGTENTAHPGTSHMPRFFRKLKEGHNKSEIPTNRPQPTNNPSDITAQYPVINPQEVAPFGAEIFLRNQNVFLLDEIHLRYGTSGFHAATFAFRFTDEKGEALPYTEIMFDPDGDNERVLDPKSGEYSIRFGELKIFLEEQNRNVAKGSKTFFGLDRHVTLPVSEINKEILDKVLEAISPNLGHSFDPKSR